MVQRPLERPVSLVAVLPVVSNKLASQERVMLVRSLVETELRKKGFNLLEQRFINEICESTSCEAREELFSRFGIDALVELELRTAMSRNFLLLYADSVSGTLYFLDRDANVIEASFQKNHRSGGVMLNTGQVYEAIDTQAESFSDVTFEPLARAFAQRIVARLTPPSIAEARFSPEQLFLGEPELEGETLCVQASPSGSLLLIGERVSATLPERSGGRYCASVHSLGKFIQYDFRAEFRTVTGLQIERIFAGVGRCPLD